MAVAKKGDKVKVSYVGKLEDGTIFDRSPDGNPFSFTIGSKEMIPELEEAVYGMKPGQTKTFTIPAEKAFGPHRKEFVFEIPVERLPKGKTYQVDGAIEVDVGGKVALARVLKVEKDFLLVDANHPLAGRSLKFELKLEAIENQ
jgi:FKBP-type peptidyl-prolyl cis-trans isomerase 2